MSSAAQSTRLALWLRRAANIGFAIAAVYCVYMVALLVLAAKRNSDFEGQSFGSFQIERIAQGSSGEAQLEAMTLESGGKKRAVVLWATWCGPCHALLSNLAEAQREGELDPSLLTAVSVAEPLSDVAAFLKESPLPFEIALDREGVVAQAMKLSGTPTVVLVDEEGIIRKVSTGGFGLSRAVISFLKGSSP